MHHFYQQSAQSKIKQMFKQSEFLESQSGFPVLTWRSDYGNISDWPKSYSSGQFEQDESRSLQTSTTGKSCVLSF